MIKCKNCNHFSISKSVTYKNTNTTTSVDFCPSCNFPIKLSSFVGKGQIDWNTQQPTQAGYQTNNTQNNRCGEIFAYMSSGYEDYLSARLLLMNENNLAGSILASQAIEKLLKALAIFYQYHPLSSYNNLTNYFGKHKPYNMYMLFIKKFTSQKKYDGPYLNLNFLLFLEKIYDLRYKSDFFEWGSLSFESRNKNFNLVFSNKQVLFELDFSMFKLMNRLTFTFNQANSVSNFQNPYHRDLNANLKNLVTDNLVIQLNQNNSLYNYTIFQNNKDAFLKNSKILEILVDSTNNLQELSYHTNYLPTNPPFDLKSHPPVINTGKIDKMSPLFAPINGVENYFNIFFKV